MSARLQASLEAQVGTLALGVELELGPEPLVLAGPNGAGKSTLLLLLLGLRSPSRGRIAWAAEGGRAGDGELLFDEARGISRPPEQRGFGWVPQEDALFPHLSAVGNVLFAVAARRPELRRGEQAERARALLEKVGLAAQAERAVEQLSGGERQRLALARALAAEPRALLLDEPLSALDAVARVELRAFLEATLRSLALPALIVTHDLDDAALLGAEIAVMEQGRIVQRGSLASLREQPLTPFVARFARGGAAPLRGETEGAR